jgi:hypothetical protein
MFWWEEFDQFSLSNSFLNLTEFFLRNIDSNDHQIFVYDDDDDDTKQKF